MRVKTIMRILTTQVYEMTGTELREWRQSQPGQYGVGRAGLGVRKGWSQQRAADWMGVNVRTWQYWEAKPGAKKMYGPPASAVRRIIEHSQSIDEYLDAILR